MRRDLVEQFYGAVVDVRRPGTLDAKPPKPCKLTENIFRAVNIALVNELKMVFDEMGIDIWEVIDAAKTKPFGLHAILSRARAWRALHSDRSVLSHRGRRVNSRAQRASSNLPARSTSRCPGMWCSAPRKP